MSPYETAMARLRGVRDAVHALDFATATDLLAEHDSALRGLPTEGQALAASEVEALRAAQETLLAQLQAVQQGVIERLGRTRQEGRAARAYLGHADG